MTGLLWVPKLPSHPFLAENLHFLLPRTTALPLFFHFFNMANSVPASASVQSGPLPGILYLLLSHGFFPLLQDTYFRMVDDLWVFCVPPPEVNSWGLTTTLYLMKRQPMIREYENPDVLCILGKLSSVNNIELHSHPSQPLVTRSLSVQIKDNQCLILKERHRL